MGMMYRVMMVAINVPPITAIAKGTLDSEPGLVAKAVGNNPKMVVDAVIITGRNLSPEPWIMASLTERPL